VPCNIEFGHSQGSSNLQDNILEYRSQVIEKFINIETLINAIICQHYFRLVIMSFFLKFYTMNILIFLYEEIYLKKY